MIQQIAGPFVECLGERTQLLRLDGKGLQLVLSWRVAVAPVEKRLAGIALHAKIIIFPHHTDIRGVAVDNGKRIAALVKPWIHQAATEAGVAVGDTGQIRQGREHIHLAGDLGFHAGLDAIRGVDHQR